MFRGNHEHSVWDVCSLQRICSIFITKVTTGQKQLLKYNIVKGLSSICVFRFVVGKIHYLSAWSTLLLHGHALSFRFIVLLHTLLHIRHYTLRKWSSSGTTSPNGKHTKIPDHWWLLLKCVKILFTSLNFNFCFIPLLSH